MTHGGHRLAEVRDTIAHAAQRAGRSHDQVTLVGVTKYLADEVVEALMADGLNDCGESRPQHLRDRAQRWPDQRWHAIGTLQANKVKLVAQYAASFHALGRLDIARALGEARLALKLEPLPCYLQVNLAQEATKAGVKADEVPTAVSKLVELGGLRLVGLMTMPPLAGDPEENRPWFRQLARLAAEVGLTELSMGTTADYPVAIEEGATSVRVGGALAPLAPDS